MLTTKIESIKARDALKITRINSKIRRIAEEEDCSENKRAIGFQSEAIGEELEPFEDEDDFDEDD